MKRDEAAGPPGRGAGPFSKMFRLGSQDRRRARYHASRHEARMIAARRLVGLALFASSAVLFPPQARSSEFGKVVDAFLESERVFDPASMSRGMCASYAEVSPIGDLDRRDQVLSFYKPEDRIPVSLHRDVLEDAKLGEVPFVIEKLTFEFTAAGVTRRSVLVGSFWGTSENGTYKVCRVQYTSYHKAKT